MPSYVPNIAKGRVVELHQNVLAASPANSAIIILAINTTDTIESIKDADTLAAILALPNTAEVTNTNYSRKVLVAADLTPVQVDDTNNQTAVGIAADQTWVGVAPGDAWTHLVFCYSPDTVSSTDIDLIPISFGDFPQTPNGGDIILAAGSYHISSEV